MKILVVNAGSSSQKYQLYDSDGHFDVRRAADEAIWQASVSWSSGDEADLRIRHRNGEMHSRKIAISDPRSALEAVLTSLTDEVDAPLRGLREIDVVGHRIVHGGFRYFEPTRIDDEVKTALREAIPLAPSHIPSSLEAIETIEEILPRIIQIAVFDTAFHRTMPQTAKIYPGPYSWYEEGIMRYGFHGISYAYLAERVVTLETRPDARRVVACHIGNGVSVTALHDGKSLDTSMGFTPLDGVMMGTRSGSVDPGILLELSRRGMTRDELDHLLEKQSGLFGISGISGDVKTLEEARKNGNQRATLALDIYAHRLSAEIASMTVSLAGFDSLIFAGGVGENSADIRAAVCAKLTHFGVQIDQEKNTARVSEDRNIAMDGTSVNIYIIATQEDWIIAKTAYQMLQ